MSRPWEIDDYELWLEWEAYMSECRTKGSRSRGLSPSADLFLTFFMKEDCIDMFARWFIMTYIPSGRAKGALREMVSDVIRPYYIVSGETIERIIEELLSPVQTREKELLKKYDS